MTNSHHNIIKEEPVDVEGQKIKNVLQRENTLTEEDELKKDEGTEEMNTKVDGDGERQPERSATPSEIGNETPKGTSIGDAHQQQQQQQQQPQQSQQPEQLQQPNQPQQSQQPQPQQPQQPQQSQQTQQTQQPQQPLQPLQPLQPQQQQPIQPYVYPPPFPYYPPIPGYVPPPLPTPGVPAGSAVPAVPTVPAVATVPVSAVPAAAAAAAAAAASAASAPPPLPGTYDYMMTGPLHPYHYTDASAMGDPSPDTRRNRGGVTEPFPEKLHRMLDACERDGLQDVVSFFSHGRAFAIHKPRRFVSEVMPRFFRQTRLTSFQRQLNLYGFRRISQGPDNGGYYHELFLKGRSGLCVNMKRTKVKGNAKLKRDPDSEPNFYSYPPIKAGPNSTASTTVTSQQTAAPPAPPPEISAVTVPVPAAQPPQSPTKQQTPASVANTVAAPSPTPATPVAATSSQPPPSMYPPQYSPYYPFTSVLPNAPPYTAAQQSASVYSYPPYFGYPWYPMPAIAPHAVPGTSQQATPQTTPSKPSSDSVAKPVTEGEENETPVKMEQMSPPGTMIEASLTGEVTASPEPQNSPTAAQAEAVGV